MVYFCVRIILEMTIITLYLTKENHTMSTIKCGNKIVLLCSKALRFFDERLISHGERVAYIASKLVEELGESKIINSSALYLMSIFHDIGAYKTEDINNLLKFETANADEHSVYGYLFLKYLTPITDNCEAVLYHHTPIYLMSEVDPIVTEYAQLINLADKIDVAYIKTGSFENTYSAISKSKHIESKYLLAFKKLIDSNKISDKKFAEESKIWSDNMVDSLELSADDLIKYLKMIIYSMEFKSPVTMLHSVNTTTISVFLGEKLNLSEETLEKLYYGALLHDIGKIAIPEAILEFKGKLDSDKMTIMRTHASYTEELLDGLFDQDIIDCAVNHHEKLDGSGYPKGLSSEQLTVEMRIVAIADITSALISRRSYKGNYDWDKTIEILQDMADKNQIDSEIANIICENNIELQNILDVASQPVEDVYNRIFAEYKELLQAMKDLSSKPIS